MSKKKINLALLGAGTVGSGVARVLLENREVIERRTGAELVLKKALVRDLKKKRPCFDGVDLTDDFADILADDEIDIVIEVMGGVTSALFYMRKSLGQKKNVVTANKDAIASFGGELLALAAENQVALMFEASVGGGIPIIAPLKHSLTANRITEIMGILNGTTNFMLTKMTEQGSDYETVLKEAQAKGYAEADPTADVDGLDAGRKLAILASIAFNTRVELESVHVEGIRGLKPLDIEYAKELGYVIKLLAVGRDVPGLGLDLKVHPVLLPKEHPLSAVNGVNNAIFLRGNALGEAMFYGQGAGSLPTASAVVADVIEVARGILAGNVAGVGCTCYETRPLCPFGETESSYYIRLLVDDEPGVLGRIATAFGHSQVSLKSVVQTKRSIVNHAEIVVVTHSVKEKYIAKAIENIKALEVVDEVHGIVRAFHLGR